MGVRQPSPDDVLKLGQQNATIKANMPRKRWAAFVKLAHARGHTIGGELSNQPDALKERTSSSLKSEAAKSVAAAYAPATQALDTRQAAIGYLDDKRKADDASYRTWLTGETDKLNAQAAAADATLASTQQGIANDTSTAIAAARADSLKRMAANAGNVSNPAQSAALDTSAADAAALNHVASAREQTATIAKIGGDSRALASASLLAQQAARESTRQADTLKSLGDLATDRTSLTAAQAKDTLDQTNSAIGANAANVSANRESDLAAASLGVKQDDLANQLTIANQKYKIETAKFGLDKWKADNAAAVAQAKLDLGYAGIKSREGVAAANRKLDEKLAKIKAAGTAKTKSKGVTPAERTLYDHVTKAQALLIRWDKNNAVPLGQRDQHLRDQGFDQAAIDVAHDLARNGGVLSNAARVMVRKYGVIHSGYFWPPSVVDTNSTIPTTNLGQTGHA